MHKRYLIAAAAVVAGTLVTILPVGAAVPLYQMVDAHEFRYDDVSVDWMLDDVGMEWGFQDLNYRDIDSTWFHSD